MGTDGAIANGRVLQVNVSPGGVPKRAVETAWVSTLGLEGDRHSEPTVHGGPQQAVCLYGIEAIERLQSEGHPVEPGSVGENLTTTGIEWSLLPVGARAAIGDQLVLEVASSTTPCKTQIPNFSDGRFSRISIDLHPSDSRMYARVVQEGEVKAGDLITVTSPSPDSRAVDLLLLKRLDRVESKSMIAAWKAAQESGYEISIVEDGELAMAASRELPGPAFNHASGFVRYPHLIDRATAFFDRHGTQASIWLEDQPWPDAESDVTVSVFAALPEDVSTDFADGVTVRLIGPEDADKYSGIRTGAPSSSGVAVTDTRDPWRDVYARLARWPHRFLFLAELDGKPAGSASLHVHGGTGWLRGAAVDANSHHRGVQRALIAARAQKAIEEGCDLIGSWAEPDEASAANLARMGMRPIGQRTAFKYPPPAAVS